MEAGCGDRRCRRGQPGSSRRWRLVDRDGAEQLGRNVGEVDRLAVDAGGEGVAAVELGADEAEAADDDARTFDREVIGIVATGEAVDRERRGRAAAPRSPNGRESADVLGGDRVDDRVGIALDVLRIGKAGADAGDVDDRVGLGQAAADALQGDTWSSRRRSASSGSAKRPCRTSATSTEARHRRSRFHARDPGDVQARHRVPRLGPRSARATSIRSGRFGAARASSTSTSIGCACSRKGGRASSRNFVRRAWPRGEPLRPAARRKARAQSTFAYAYQFDATSVRALSAQIAERLGAARTEGKVVDVERDGETGDVPSLEMESGERIDGDLFVDCSGFVSLLIGKTLASRGRTGRTGCRATARWRCRAGPRPRCTPYTSAIAMDAGWRWRIPLQHRTGNGYVYSSAFIATRTRPMRWSARSRASRSPNRACCVQGRPPRARLGRAIASRVGLASGFLEPLESTSIYLIQAAITAPARAVSGEADLDQPTATSSTADGPRI